MNWGAMVRAAASVGVGPDAFWRLSLKEWRWLTDTTSREATIGRAAFDALAQQWPDACDGHGTIEEAERSA